MTTNLNGGRGWLSDAAAASLHRMDAAYGGRLPITSAGRTNAQQWEAWRKYQAGGPVAAYPGTSIHESGNAVDFGSGAWGWLGSGFGLGWNGARANDYGWRRTVSSESWHFEYDASRDKHRGGGGGGNYAAPIKDIQNLANKLGATLTVDGDYGPATAGWVRAFQGDHGLAVDGIVGPQTWSKMQAVAAQASNNNADWNRAIQEKLNRLGYNLSVDGQVGPATTAAIRDFQSKNGLPVDGIAGPITNNKLDAVLTAGNPNSQLTVDGEWGAATTRKLQTVLGVTADGELGPQTIKALQTRLNVEADGLMGPGTTRALQRAVSAADDGEIGPNTIKALQNYLNAGGNFLPATTPGPAPTTPAPSTSLTVDGEWGPATTKALQTKLKVTVDGELGPETWNALQTALGATADGQPGPQTYKALQTFLGVGVDGAMGPATIKALQTFLNSNGEFKKVEIPAEPIPELYPKPATATYPESETWNHSPNSSPRRNGDKIEYFVIHHAADTSSIENQRNRFMRANDRNVSPNWLIGKDGSAHEIVPPDNFRAWTTGQFDYKAVTVETQNTSAAPNWGISAESHERIAKLVAWASKRYGFPIDRVHVIGHREVPGISPTACPGPSMSLDSIVERAKIIASATPTTPIPEPEPEPQPEPKKWTIELDLDEAKEFAKFLDEWRKLLP